MGRKNYIIAGLGNPGEKYQNTRHNTGREFVMYFQKKCSLPEFQMSKNKKFLASQGIISKNKIQLILPETFMNKSGEALEKYRAENLIVVHDDIDLKLGEFKIAFNRGSAGHKGVESIIRKMKTKKFIRIRIGISPIKKPLSKMTVPWLLGKFKPSEERELKKVFKKIAASMLILFQKGLQKTMSIYN